MGQILIGQKFTTTQIEYEEELHDAEYCKRVFGLSHTIAYRTTSVCSIICIELHCIELNWIALDINTLVDSMMIPT